MGKFAYSVDGPGEVEDSGLNRFNFSLEMHPWLGPSPGISVITDVVNEMPEPST